MGKARRAPQARRSAAVTLQASPPAPAWLRWVILGLAALLLVAWLSREAGDSDSWWHLKTGQFILTQHRLPVPDPFAYTTYLGKPLYSGEEVTRYFNLTHEWLAQIAMYGAYAAAGLTGLILARAAMLSLFCALAGLMAYRRTRSFPRALVAVFAAAMIVHAFTADRPQYFTYVFLALTLNLLDARRRLWLLPPLFLIWANCHGGFFLGWVAVAIYCAEAGYFRWRGKPVDGERRLWLAGLSAILASGFNPNGFRVFEVLWNYGRSPLQAQILEWYHPVFWELSPFTVLLYGGVVALIWNRRKTRPADWLLLAAFGSAGLLAFRNVVLAGFVGAFLIAAYVPMPKSKIALRERPAAGFAVAALLLAGTLVLIAQGKAFRFRASPRTPVGAADFLLDHHIQGKLFNTYGQGGYLIWRLWPRWQVFVDGRVLNESVAYDAQRIMYAADDSGGKSFDDLLRDYRIDVIVMDCFEPVSGAAYYLPTALADPRQTEWKLVYRDGHDVIYMRRPPPGLAPLNPLDGLVGMEQQCAFLTADGAPACAKGMVDVFTRIGDLERAHKWAVIQNGAHVE